MEKQILEQVNRSIGEAIVNSLTKYDSPLKILTDAVIKKHTPELESLINDEFSLLLNGKGFKQSLREALNEKLSRTLIQRMGGELEKQVNELKQNPQTKAKITLAISDIIENLHEGDTE